jgi:asparagine synthase (glutamine-hydrolysing)
MSGIVGVLGVEGKTPDSFFLETLTRSMEFRGPDSQRTWLGDSVGFAHALLSTTSEPASEPQPLSLNGVAIVVDSRLDGRRDLLRDLHSAGPACATRASDAELILHAYAAWDEACLQHLLGDFCFAIWNRDRKSLFCARDHLGIKPFYYARTKSWLVFSNTLDCFRMVAGDFAELNGLAVADFLLFGANQDTSSTIFARIQRLPPAHSLTWRDDQLLKKRYWSPPVDEEIHYKRSEQYEEQFRELLEIAVRDRLRTDRATISLSGGLDSSSVAAVARRVGTNELRALTIVYDKVMPHDERHYAGLIAESLGIPIEFFLPPTRI